MGRSTTPAYRVEYRDNAQARTIAFQSNGRTVANLPTRWAHTAWNRKQHGHPTDANLEKWRVAYNASFKEGGVNHHVSVELGIEIHISHARIIHQASGSIVARAQMSMFEVA